MHRLTGLWINTNKKETVITTHCQCEYKTESGFSGFHITSMPSKTEQDFEAIYKIISDKINLNKPHNLEANYTTRLEGRLNGVKIDETFSDLESYHQYLQFSLLIETSDRPHLSPAIHLLKQFGFIDNPNHQDLSTEQQLQIKRALLTLPETCRELATYGESYYFRRPKDDVIAIGYKSEVFATLQSAIPSLQDIKLTGRQTGFIPGINM
tara:strand:+ start:493 stop:1122 length:630 start_codon:yes stop_codon:yes gene_type:complete